MSYDGLGARIKALRVLLGYTQEALAELLEINQTTLSRIERSLAPADDGLVDAIMSVTGVPESFLRADPVGINQGSLRFRKRSTARKTETKQIVQLFMETYRVCSDIAAKRRIIAPDLPAPSRDGEPRVENIEHLAAAARSALGVPAGRPVPHVTRTYERAGIFIVPIRLPGAAPDENVLGHSGASFWRGRWESPLIGYVPAMPGDRLRFTLAHELGHIILHGGRELTRAAETEAHVFAGAFLLPRQQAEEAFSIMPTITLGRLKAMKAGWGMAIAALVMRAWHLGFIDNARRRSLFQQLAARGWRANEPVKVHLEQPLLLRKLLTAEYGDPIDWRRASDELGLRADVLQILAPEPCTGSPVEV